MATPSYRRYEPRRTCNVGYIPHVRRVFGILDRSATAMCREIVKFCENSSFICIKSLFNNVTIRIIIVLFSSAHSPNP